MRNLHEGADWILKAASHSPLHVFSVIVPGINILAFTNGFFFGGGLLA